MGNTQKKYVFSKKLAELLPGNQEVNIDQLIEAFSFEEVELCHKLYENLRLQSRRQQGIDKHTFVMFSGLTCIWAVGLFKVFKSTASQSAGETHSDARKSSAAHITFPNFLEANRLICRSGSIDLDRMIFKLFDLKKKTELQWEDVRLMLVNLPVPGINQCQEGTRLDSNDAELR